MNQEGPMGEILLINKPVTWTSFDAVKKVKWVKRAKKAGHAGTLDPLASGLLIICTEKQTKKINLIQDAEKEYTGTIVLGSTTPSYDLETEVNERFETNHITKSMVDAILPTFTGEIMQAPPLYSALKVGGERAYKLARRGSEHKLEKRSVTIKEFEITDFTAPYIRFRVVCSKGTYIRSLANDFGLALGSGAYLTDLVRTRIGEYRLENAITPMDLQKELRPDN